MNYGALLMALLTYIVVAVSLAGTAWHLWNWARVPLPFRLTIFPAAKNQRRAIAAVVWETLTFRSLWHGNKEAWASAWFFHAFLAFCLIGHAVGVATLGLQFCLLGFSAARSMALSRLFGAIMGILLLLSLTYLLGRRLALAHLRLISRPGDYFILVLLLAIVISGNWMRFFNEVDYAAVHDFLAGILTFKPVPPPDNPFFIIHYILVMFLLMYFPVSKMVHTCGFFFSRWIISRYYPRQTHLALQPHRWTQNRYFPRQVTLK
ncbi:respiratory nitrate reductase subunit gamma [Neomoorella humiferrea]|uniref:respiratory nitrate reductase subunit gamma n=1 Tax=Neomoorella humiferrea TaxID=676965 RepID=UPI003D8B4347